MAELLAIENLSAGYGEAVVLSQVSLTIPEGQSLALLGRNGMGKTTLVNTHRRRDALSRRHDPARRARHHAACAPTSARMPASAGCRRSATSSSRSPCDENLTAVARPGPWTTAKVYAMFPRLAERRRNLGNQLSGGEQQMLAVGRALILNPRIILLDEPLEGLAPIIVEELLAALRRIIREEGLSAILVEQNAKKILGVTDRAAIIERGGIVHEADSAALATDPAVLEKYLGVTHSERAVTPAVALDLKISDLILRRSPGRRPE